MALQDDINNFNCSNTAGDFLSLAAELANTTTDRMITVANASCLPDLSNNNIIPGTVFFVESLGVPVIAQIGCWTGLDNRELRNDFTVGLVYSWGFNNCGQLGNNTTISTSSPVSVVGGFTDWCQVSVAACVSLGVRQNGTAWSWGHNGAYGKLGDGTNTNRSSPVSIVGGFTDWCQVSAGYGHNHGIRTNGTLWSWGCNFYGQLGDNSLFSDRFIVRNSPISVVGGFTDWCQVSAGRNHSLAVRSNGTAWGWGNNFYGRLGNGTTTSARSPVSVVGGFTDWCQVSAGNNHSLGVRQDGTAWAWGCNAAGKLGDNTIINKSSPVSVVGGYTDWCQVDAGRIHSFGVRTNGSAWGCGCARCGVLGDNSTINKSSPVSVVGGFTDWCQVTAFTYTSIGLRSNGTIWAWGSAFCGIFGNNQVTDRSSPVQNCLATNDVGRISRNSDGSTHALAIRIF